MNRTHDHDDIVKDLALLIERDPRYALVKYFTPWSDAKTDVIGAFYPDVTTLRREGKTKIMIEVVTPTSFEDPEEVWRLEGLSSFCTANQWEFYIACPDSETRSLLERKIEGREIRPRGIFVTADAPFRADPQVGNA